MLSERFARADETDSIPCLANTVEISSCVLRVLKEPFLDSSAEGEYASIILMQ